MQRFEEIYQRALERKGPALEAGLSAPGPADELREIPDHRFLARMTRSIFQAGFVWKVIEAKWDGFEAAFQGFNPHVWAHAPDEKLEALASDERIVRNYQKIKTVRPNASMILEAGRDRGGFGGFLADWPANDQIGLMDYLGKHGSRLGGMTAQYFLRFAGWDAYILSRDVVAALIAAGVVDRAPTSKAAKQAVQGAFNDWQKESGRPYAQISRVLAQSIDA